MVWIASPAFVLELSSDTAAVVPLGSVGPFAFMVAAEQEEILWIGHFVAEEQRNCFQTHWASIDVVCVK